MTDPTPLYRGMRNEMRHVYENLNLKLPIAGFYLRRKWCMEHEECITGVLAECAPAVYEWLYTEPEMNRPGHEDWIPLCEECCVYWRKLATRPYRVRTLRGKVTS